MDDFPLACNLNHHIYKSRTCTTINRKICLISSCQPPPQTPIYTPSQNSRSGSTTHFRLRPNSTLPATSRRRKWSSPSNSDRHTPSAPSLPTCSDRSNRDLLCPSKLSIKSRRAERHWKILGWSTLPKNLERDLTEVDSLVFSCDKTVSFEVTLRSQVVLSMVSNK